MLQSADCTDWWMFIDGYFYRRVVGNSTDTSKQGWLNLPKIYEPYQNSRHHKDMNLNPFRGSTHVRCCYRTNSVAKTTGICTLWAYIYTYMLKVYKSRLSLPLNLARQQHLNCMCVCVCVCVCVYIYIYIYIYMYVHLEHICINEPLNCVITKLKLWRKIVLLV